VLTRRLARQGHAVTAVASGGEALEILRAERFDLVLLDILMPEMDGYEVLRRLKADPALRDLPVIVISALDELESVVRCIEMGAEDYLPKPFDSTLLKARIGACLEKKRLRDQELAYLQSVAQVTQAAAAVEAGTFDPKDLDAVAARPDALGQLARVFQRMAREVRAREERLTRQVQELRIQVDEAQKVRTVAEITTTDYFQSLQQRAQQLRNRGGGR
jgi:DNA-binding response OmpR family regulator